MHAYPVLGKGLTTAESLISGVVAPQNLVRRAHECSAGAIAMLELHVAHFVSEEPSQDGYLAFSLNRQALRRIDALRAARCNGAERIAVSFFERSTWAVVGQGPGRVQQTPPQSVPQIP